MTTLPHIVLLEDDRPTREMYSAYLSETGLDITAAEQCSQVRDVLKTQKHIDLAILDLNLPDGDGIELVKEIRNASSIPIIVVTARGDETDKIVGLELGADDYLVKPISPRELRVRIGNILKRLEEQKHAQPGEIITCAGITLDANLRQTTLADGEMVNLTNGEFELLRTLFENQDVPVSRQVLLDKISGYSGESQSRSIDTMVYRLRSKLKIESGKVIHTVHGFGYKLICDE